MILLTQLKHFFWDDSGQGIVEYGLILALIAVVVIVAIKALGGSVSGIFNKIAEEVEEFAPAE